MAMTEEKIRAVKDESTYLLLKEPRFRIEGKEYQLLNEIELRNKRTVYTPGVDREDKHSEGIVVTKTVTQLVNYNKQGTPFELVNINDSKLIFTIIDTFIQAQARLLPDRIGGIKEPMLEDFHDLTNLANKMLAYIDLADRVHMMNAPVVEDKGYQNIFDIMLGNLATSSPAERLEEPSQQNKVEGYVSPFTNLINNRNFVNRIDRFN